MPRFILKWFVNGQHGSQEFFEYEDASDTANAIIKLNRYCYVCIYNGKNKVFSYEKLGSDEVMN
jgi:hypothetical protein